MKTVLGLDLGTQSLKADFYDFEIKRHRAIVSSPLKLNQDDTGKAEQSATWWLTALRDCLNQVDQEIKDSIQAISVSGQQHGFVPLDKNGIVLAPVKLWCDTTTQQEVEEISANCGGIHKAIELTGNPVLAGYTSPKIRWLKNHAPEAYTKLAHILLPHDYLNFVLTGKLCMEYGDASGTGLLDIKTREWSTPMLSAVDEHRNLLDCLPPLVPHDQFIGTTTEQIEREYGIPSGIPVAAGGGDNMMGAIGTDNVSPGKLTISLGSSGTLYTYSDSPIIDPRGNIAAFCSSTNGWLPLLCTMNCTMATELIRNTLGISLEQFDPLAEQIPPGSDGLLMLPFFNGERTPNLPYAKGCILGMDSSNSSKQHMLRSAIEAVTYSLKFGYDELVNLGIESNEITLTGGGSRSSVWRQIIADVFQLPVNVLSHEEGASFGAALQGLWVLLKKDSPSLSLQSVLSEHIHAKESDCTQANTGNASIYQESYTNYQNALQQITPLYKEQS